TMEVGAPFAGKVVQVSVKPGQELKIGQVYCVLEGGNGEAPAAPARKEAAREEPSPREVQALREQATPTRDAPRVPAAAPPGAHATGLASAPSFTDGGIVPASQRVAGPRDGSPRTTSRTP